MRKLLKIIGHKLFDAIIIVWKLSWMSHFAMIGKKATDINQVQYLSMAIFSAITIGDWRTTWFMNGQIRYFFQKKCRIYFWSLRIQVMNNEDTHSCTNSCTKLYLFTEVDFQNEIKFLNCFFSSWTVTTWLF